MKVMVMMIVWTQIRCDIVVARTLAVVVDLRQRFSSKRIHFSHVRRLQETLIERELPKLMVSRCCDCE